MAPRRPHSGHQLPDPHPRRRYQQTVNGATSFQFSPANLAFGAGYIGGNWPAEPNYQKTNSSDYRYYLNGEIADMTYSYPGGP